MLLGPVLPAVLPLPGWQGRLARVLPAGVTLGLGALGATWMGRGSVSLVLSALLIPSVALTLLAWLGQAGPASLSGDGMLRFAAGTAPALLTVLLGGALGGWLTPVALLLLSGVVLTWSGASRTTRWSGSGPAPPPPPGERASARRPRAAPCGPSAR